MTESTFCETPTVATLCTGGGLFEVGAMMAGFSPIWGVEFDPDNPEVSSLIADCYERNLAGNLIRQTIQDLAAEGFDKLEHPTALHVSPPCKSFSQANQGVTETSLDLQIARAVSQAIRELTPPLFTLENVVKYRDSQSWRTILKTLIHLGYGVQGAIVNAADYGVPQVRKRYLVWASLDGLPPLLRPKVDKWIGWYSAIADLIPTLPESKLADWQIERIDEALLSNARESAFLIERSGARSDRDLLIRSANEPCWTIKASIATDQKGANRYDPINALLPDGKVVSLNARAIARLQSVPDWYQLPDQIGIAVTLLGNGVPCLLAEVAMNTLISTRSDRSPQAIPVVSVSVVETEELTFDEQRERDRLEHQIERAFYEAGCALRLLRDKRLYRSTHSTFEEYCRERFGFSRDSAYLKIGAADVYETLDKNLPTIGRQIPLPTNERQLRYLAKAKLEPAQQVEVWQKAVEKAGGKIPSGRIVKSIVQQEFGQKPDTSEGNDAEPNRRPKREKFAHPRPTSLFKHNKDGRDDDLKPELFSASQVSEKIREAIAGYKTEKNQLLHRIESLENSLIDANASRWQTTFAKEPAIEPLEQKVEEQEQIIGQLHSQLEEYKSLDQKMEEQEQIIGQLRNQLEEYKALDQKMEEQEQIIGQYQSQLEEYQKLNLPLTDAQLYTGASVKIIACTRGWTGYKGIVEAPWQDGWWVKLDDGRNFYKASQLAWDLEALKKTK